MTQPYFVQYYLGDTPIDNPVERAETSIQVQFDEQTQGSVETTEFTFVNEAYTIIKDRIASGLNGGVGITEGLDLRIVIQQGQESTEIFLGYIDFQTLIDLTSDDEFVNEPKILASVVQTDGLNNLSERLEGLTFALLEANGTITSSDYRTIKYLVEKETTFLEQAFLALSIYLMIKELSEASYRLAQQIATIASFNATPPSGTLGGLVYAIAAAIFEAAYILVMGAALLELIQSFIENIFPFEKEFNGISFRTALVKVFEYLGYTFVSPIDDLDKYVYLPSKAEGRQDRGVPFDSDFGFIANEFVSLCLNMFRAEIFVSGDEVQMRTKKDPFLIQQSNYILPATLERPFTYNLADIKESRFFSFQEDVSDSYTISNWKGTSLVVTTTPITQEKPKNNLLKGLEEKRFPVALGSEKKELSNLEEALNSFLQAANFVLPVLGKSNISQTIQNRIRLLKISQEFFSVPKVLNMSGEKLAINSRDGLSSLYLWNTYHNYDSFVQNNFERQRKEFDSVRIPFSYEDYKKVLKNSYFITENGQTGKFTSLKWVIEGDEAEVSFWIQETYTNNLQEELTEVE